MNYEYARLSSRPFGRWLPSTTLGLLATLVAACASGGPTDRPAANPGIRARPDAEPATVQVSVAASPARAPQPPESLGSIDPADDSHLGCTRATFPSHWHRGDQRGFSGWSREPVIGRDGVLVTPFAGFFDIPRDVEPITAFANAAAVLRESKPLFGDSKDYPLEHSVGRRGYSTDPDQSVEHLDYLLIAGCGSGRSQMIVLDTTRDTEGAVDRELRGILQSMRFPLATNDR